MNHRVTALLAGTAALAAVAATSVVVARGRVASASASTSAVSLTGHALVARSTATATRGHLVRVSGERLSVSNVTCDRVYAAHGTGVCLRRDGDLLTYQLAALDSQLNVTSTIPLVGVPNRARVSPSGQLVAWTVFVAGDSYNGGHFSTRAGLYDLRRHELVASLEDFAVVRDGKPYRARDLNFWGVTFAADDRHFFATMSTAGTRYLVAGDLTTRTLTTVRANVECPSLSPDGTRIAYKAAVGGDPRRGWRLSVLDLARGTVTALAETRSVDDQPAWLDDRRVAYGIARRGGHADVWSVPADGSGTPAVLIPDAESPAAL